MLGSTCVRRNICDFVHAVHINATVADGNGCVYLVGYGQVQPTSGVAQPTYGGGHYDAIVAKWSADGRELIYAMNLGGGDDEAAQAIAVDASGNAYVAGFTYSSDFPTSPGAFQSKNRNPGDRFYNSLAGYFPGGDVFVSKISADGKSFLFSSLAGGTSDEAASAIAVDVAGDAYVTGYTRSADFPVSARALGAETSRLADKGDASFIFKLNAYGNGPKLLHLLRSRLGLTESPLIWRETCIFAGLLSSRCSHQRATYPSLGAAARQMRSSEPGCERRIITVFKIPGWF